MADSREVDVLRGLLKLLAALPSNAVLAGCAPGKESNVSACALARQPAVAHSLETDTREVGLARDWLKLPAVLPSNAVLAGCAPSKESTVSACAHATRPAVAYFMLKAEMLACRAAD